MASPLTSTQPASVDPPTVAAEGDSRSPEREHHRDRWVTAGVVAIASAAYLRSLLPGVGFSGDTAKWQTLSVVGGVPHATGYPLYVALIQAFHWMVPLGSAAWRINLFSAVAGAGAVAVLYRLLRILDIRWDVAAATALIFAFTRTFWMQAVVAEVYTLHLLFVVSVLACLARWRLGGSNRWLLAGTGLLALSFGNHLGTVLLLPSVAWLVATDWRRAVSWRNGLWLVLVAALGASQYLYLFYMTDVGGYVESPVHSLRDLWNVVSGRQFSRSMWAFTPGELVHERIPMLWDFLRGEYRILLVLTAVGLVRGLWRWGSGRRHVVIAVVLLGLASTTYGLDYDVLDVVVFFIPLFLALAVLLGIGLDGIVGWIAERLPTDRPRLALGISGGLLAIPLATGLLGYREASQRGNVPDHQRIERVLGEIHEPVTIVSADYHESEYLWYFLLAEGVGSSHHIEVSHGVTPAMLQQYFDTGGVAADGTSRPPRTPLAMTHPPFVTIDADLAHRMADAGLTVTDYAPGIWRIRP